MHLELCAQIILGPLAVLENKARVVKWLQVHGAKVDFAIRENATHLVQDIVPGARTRPTERQVQAFCKNGTKIKTHSEKSYLLVAAAQAGEEDETSSEVSKPEKHQVQFAATPANIPSVWTHNGRTRPRALRGYVYPFSQHAASSSASSI